MAWGMFLNSVPLEALGYLDPNQYVKSWPKTFKKSPRGHYSTYFPGPGSKPKTIFPEGSGYKAYRNMIMMQTGVKMQSMRHLMQRLQTHLESGCRHRCQRAGQLKQMLETKFHGVKAETRPTEVSELMAMLVVYEEEACVDSAEPRDSMDVKWFTDWWTQIVRLLEGQGQTQSAESSTSACARVKPASAAIDLDTPPFRPLQADDLVGVDLTELEELEQQKRREEEAIMNEYESMKAQEDADLQAQIDAFEREDEARRAKEEDEAALQQAMEERPPQRRRLQIDLTAEADDGVVTRARMHVPLPSSSSGTTMRMTFSIGNEGQHEHPSHALPHGPDEQSFMQTHLHPRRLEGFRGFLQGLLPPLRRRVLRDLRRRVQEEMRNSLCHGVHYARMVSFFEAALHGLEQEGEEVEEIIEDEMVHDIVEPLLRRVREGALLPHEDLQQMLDQIREIVTGIQRVGSRASSSREGPTPLQVPGTTEEVHGVIMDVEQALANLIQGLPVDDRMETTREMMLTLCAEAQTQAARLRCLLHMVAHRLPQPYSETRPKAQQVGHEAAEYVLEAIHSAFGCQVESSVGSSHYSIDEMVPVWSSLGPLAMEIMQLLETGMFDTDMSSASTPTSPVYPELGARPPGPSDYESTYGIGTATVEPKRDLCAAEGGEDAEPHRHALEDESQGGPRGSTEGSTGGVRDSTTTRHETKGSLTKDVEGKGKHKDKDETENKDKGSGKAQRKKRRTPHDPKVEKFKGKRDPDQGDDGPARVQQPLVRYLTK